MKKRNHEKRNHFFQNKKEIMKISLSPYVFQMNPVKTLPESIDLKPDWVHYLTGYVAENLWGKNTRQTSWDLLPPTLHRSCGKTRGKSARHKK